MPSLTISTQHSIESSSHGSQTKKEMKGNQTGKEEAKLPLYADAAATAAKSFQSCLTLCDPLDISPPGSPIPGILQARTLEWVAISFSNA